MTGFLYCNRCGMKLPANSVSKPHGVLGSTQCPANRGFSKFPRACDLDLSDKELAIYEFLLLNHERFVTKAEIMQAVWTHQVEGHALQQRIFHLGKKLKNKGVRIENKYGGKYKLVLTSR